MTPRLTTAAFLFVGTFCIQMFAAPKPATQNLAVCAAFAPEGTSATVTVDDAGLSLEITDPFGRVTHLTEPLRYPVPKLKVGNNNYQCEAHFDQASNWLAIGVNNGFPNQQLQITVADLKSLNWIGEWGVEPKSGVFSPIEGGFLGGFLDGTTSLAVFGEPPSSDGRGIRHGSFVTLLFDPTGKQLVPMPITRNYADQTNLYPHYADATHNRLWFCRCVSVSATASRQPIGPIESVSLTGGEHDPSPEYMPSATATKRTDLWFLPTAFVVPDCDTVLIAEGNNVWRVNTQERSMDRIVIPVPTHFPRVEPFAVAETIS